NIFVKDRKSAVGQLVSETILTFRRYLIDQKIQSLMDAAKDPDATEEDKLFLEDVIQYQNLKKLLSRKLNRVL
ncbi:DNA primase, partial [Flavobacteriaceae bacterium]|nr:DNA primase [Flavobacteriaceae bacterium]